MNNDEDKDWFIFDTYREMKVMENNKLLVIRPFDKQTNVPLFCPLCKFPMKTIEDGISYRDTMLCNKCEHRWKGKNKEEIDSSQWEDYLKERELMARPIFIFR